MNGAVQVNVVIENRSPIRSTATMTPFPLSTSSMRRVVVRSTMFMIGCGHGEVEHAEERQREEDEQARDDELRDPVAGEHVRGVAAQRATREQTRRSP